MDGREKRLLAALPPDARSDEREFYEKRIGELSEYERIKLEGALELYPPGITADVINLTYMLDGFELLYGVIYDEQAQTYMAECSIPEEERPHFDMRRLGREKWAEAGMHAFTDRGFVIQTSNIKYGWDYYTGTNLSELRDTDYAVKLKLTSAARPEGTWLKLPCFDPGNGTLPAQQAALDYLTVSSLEECSVMDASCVFQQVIVHPRNYDNLNNLLEDAVEFGMLMDMPKDRLGISQKGKLFMAVLECLNGVTLANAVRIADNLDQCEIIAESAEQFGQEFARKLYTESSETQYHQGYDFESYGNSILQAVSELTGAVFTTTSCGIIRWNDEPFFGLPRMNLPSAAWKQSEDSVLRLGLQFKGKSMEFPLPTLPNHIPLILREMNCNSLNECWMRLTIDNSLTVDISPDDLDYTDELQGILRQFTKNDIEKYKAVLEYEYEQDEIRALGTDSYEPIDAAGLINFANNLECYEFYPSKTFMDDEGYGRYIVEQSGLTIPQEFEEFFHYEELGEELKTEQAGIFVPGGYIYKNNNPFQAVYPKEQEESPGMRL